MKNLLAVILVLLFCQLGVSDTLDDFFNALEQSAQSAGLSEEATERLLEIFSGKELTFLNVERPVHEPDEAQARFDANLNRGMRLVNRTLTHSPLAALEFSGHLGLNGSQYEAISKIRIHQPTDIIRHRLHWEDLDKCYRQDENAFNRSLSSLERELKSAEKVEVKELSKVLSTDQRDLLHELYFSKYIDIRPVQALAGAGMYASHSQAAKIFEAVQDPTLRTLEAKRQRLFELFQELGFDVKGLGEFGALDIEVDALKRVLCFGGKHHRLRECSPPPPGTFCPECMAEFTESGRGYRIGKYSYHEDCFTRAIANTKARKTPVSPRLGR